MDSAQRIAVIAGTPVDTRMGIAFLRANLPDAQLFARPVSKDPQEQTLFQISDAEKKEAIIGKILAAAKYGGIDKIFVYCNSLSGSVDFKSLSAKYNLKIVTPLAAYEEISKEHSRLAVLAANNQSLAGIESAALRGNPDIEVIGVSLLQAVKAIETNMLPQSIVSDLHLSELTAFFKNAGATALVLGCTHFPYFEKELSAVSSLPVINPAEYMLDMIIQ